MLENFDNANLHNQQPNEYGGYSIESPPKETTQALGRYNSSSKKLVDDTNYLEEEKE